MDRFRRLTQDRHGLHTYDGLIQLRPKNVKKARRRARRHDNEIVRSFRRGWRDMLEGRTHPLSELWDEL